MASEAVPASTESKRSSVEAALTQAIASLETEQTLRKSIREAIDPIDDISRAASSELNKLHSAPPAEHAAICERCLEIVGTTKAKWADVSALIPSGEFYRYQFAVGPALRGLVTSIALARFVLHDELVPAFTVSSILGLSGEVVLSAEDYLQGVIGMVNELPRLSINAVTAQNFALPHKIASFVNDIFASYSLLNLRNDALRRKFDSLKYDLKRCEDVVYDLTLRGLASAPAS